MGLWNSVCTAATVIPPLDHDTETLTSAPIRSGRTASVAALELERTLTNNDRPLNPVAWIDAKLQFQSALREFEQARENYFRAVPTSG